MSQPPITPEQLAALPPEFRALLQSIIDHYEARIKKLEAELAAVKKTPQNSSLPPSSQHPHSKPLPPPKSSSKLKRGGQPGHPKHERVLIPVEDCTEIVPLHPPECRRCGEKLAGDDPNPVRHQVWELPRVEPLVTEYQRHRRTCASCGITTCAELPPGVPEGQSGPRLTAATGVLMAYFRQSKRKTAEAIRTLFHVPCSPALTVKQQDIVTAALKPCHDELKAALPKVTAASLDETGTKEGRRKAWIWTAVTGKFTLFLVRLTRGAEVAKELLGEPFGGVITTDRYNGYHWHKQRQFCWAHLMRDFQGLIDGGGDGKRIGTELQRIGQELFRHWHRARDGTISRKTMRRNIGHLSGRMYQALENGQRCRHAPTVTLCNELFNRFDSLWTFRDHADVQPTNNAAERALRHAVIWRKLSFGTQSAGGSRFVETMLSVIETCRQQDRTVLDFITDAVAARFAKRAAPKILVEV